MAGLPAQLLMTPKSTSAMKIEGNGSVKGSNGEVKIEGEEVSSQGAFQELLANLFGNEKSEVIQIQKPETSLTQIDSQKTSKEGDQKNIDLLLKKNTPEDKKLIQVPVQVLSPETILGLNKLLSSEPGIDEKTNPTLEKKISSTSSQLDELLETIKNEKNNSSLETILNSENIELNGEGDKTNPLDFLLKKGAVQKNDLGNVLPQIMEKSEHSKLGLSSEDFVAHLKESSKELPKELFQELPKELSKELTGESKEFKDVKIAKASEVKNKDQSELSSLLNSEQIIDPKMLAQKQMGQNVKAYGQKQNLLNDHLIKSPKDFLTKDKKIGASSDELKSPDLKIGAELSQIKESFIPLMNQKNELQSETQVGQQVKVLDLSKINTSNTNEIIKRISDYVQQNQVANKDSLDLTVRHDSLGQFNIQVNKPVGNQAAPMDMQITTMTPEGHEFFMKNEVSLMKNLSQAGIQLSDLRIVSSSDSSSMTQNDSRNSSNSQSGQNAQKEFMSFDSGNSSEGSQRRKELWQEARSQQRYGA